MDIIKILQDLQSLALHFLHCSPSQIVQCTQTFNQQSTTRLALFVKGCSQASICPLILSSP